MIGFIGLGIMGENMASNLLAVGEKLTVHNRTKSKAQPLLDKGAEWASSPKEVAEKADIVFTMLTNPGAVESVALGEDGLLKGLSENKIWVDCSTVNPEFSKAMANKTEAAGCRFIDAPVAGSKDPAEKGLLNFLVGGNEQDVKEVKSYLDIMGKSIQYMGSHGNGIATKLAVNLSLVTSMATFAEAVTFGESLGLDRKQLIDVLLTLPVTAPVLKGKREMMIENSTFEAQFPLEHAHKDLQQIAETAYKTGAPLPVTHGAKELYAFAKQNGLSKKDFAAVYQLLASEGAD
ncbi:NAD(P)-dependent oxidoreductase [Virgibacillus senegalensis]|uniref:NAD(P)-dependent oxidoreductase n=1 Tax=Virgibacillus senegalensis TaxID=1499679 RepID=UPI00069CFE8B|nr:NAD(P)-dependent oxidoreductase [Virgibacillus senegalensis]